MLATVLLAAVEPPHGVGDVLVRGVSDGLPALEGGRDPVGPVTAPGGLLGTIGLVMSHRGPVGEEVAGALPAVVAVHLLVGVRGGVVGVGDGGHDLGGAISLQSSVGAKRLHGAAARRQRSNVGC